jgi:hypothetical protein
MRPILFFLLLGLAIAAPAAAQKNSKRCLIDPPDSSLLRRGPVYRDCEVDRPAKVLTAMRPDFQPQSDGSRASRCFSAELEFVVDTLGWAEPTTVRRVSGNSQPLAEAMVNAIATLRYEPAMNESHLVRQLVRYKQMVGVQTVVSRGGPPPPGGNGDRRPPGC